mgnify:CR=1 FL=1
MSQRGRSSLNDAWRITSSSSIDADGAALSSPGGDVDSWYRTDLPATVLGTLIEAGEYEDVFFGTNIRNIPGQGPPAQNFSNHEMPEDSPFAVPWWYRREFYVSEDAGETVTVKFDGINYRANIDVMKRCGVTDLLSVSACGSLKEEHAPGTFVLVDQFIDRTFAREKSFFGTGCVAHVSVAHPTCERLSDAAEQAARAAGIKVHRGGTYLCMEGPQFSSMAESKMYRESWGCDVIGMTNMPEAKLAREAELCYASVAMVTDYDSWHPDHGAVDISAILATLQGNSSNGRELVRRLPAILGRERADCPHGCDKALEFAIMTAPEKRDPALLARLDAVAGRVLG